MTSILSYFIRNAIPVQPRMTSILSYSRAHFAPGRRVYYEHSSAGRLAKRLYEILSSLGECIYLDATDVLTGASADVLIGEPGNFQHLCTNNRIGKKILWCSRSFDRGDLFELCDVALGVGNRTSLSKFPEAHRGKVHLTNYSVGVAPNLPSPASRKNEFIYVATEATELKGFREVMRVWKTMSAKLHVVGYMNDPEMQALFRESNSGQMEYHGYIPSDTAAFRSLLTSCRYVYLPTHLEGQVGTLIEALYHGLVALTTLESGLDARVLEHAFLAAPADTETQAGCVRTMLAMGDEEYAARQQASLTALRTYHTWDVFDRAIKTHL